MLLRSPHYSHICGAKHNFFFGWYALFVFFLITNPTKPSKASSLSIVYFVYERRAENHVAYFVNIIFAAVDFHLTNFFQLAMN